MLLFLIPVVADKDDNLGRKRSNNSEPNTKWWGLVISMVGVENVKWENKNQNQNQKKQKHVRSGDG